MKEECKLCNVNGWCGSQGTTDFSISSLMRPAVHHQGQMDPRHDAVLLSAYLFKLGDYPLYPLHDYFSNVGKPTATCTLCQPMPRVPYVCGDNHLLLFLRIIVQALVGRATTPVISARHKGASDVLEKALRK
ncbi:unnamed protein product [Colias eurytheme]|nr:unnamed protein product [Colias eurytheme]